MLKKMKRYQIMNKTFVHAFTKQKLIILTKEIKKKMYEIVVLILEKKLSLMNRDGSHSNKVKVVYRQNNLHALPYLTGSSELGNH